MADEEPHPEPAPRRGSGLTMTPAAAAALIGGIVAVVLVLALVVQGGGDDDASIDGFVPPVTTGAAGLPSTSTTPPEPAVDRPDVPPVSCNGLWSDDELVLALGSEERPYSALSSFRFSGGEVCNEELASDNAYFIKVEPGDPSDFAAGAMLNGVVGEPVADVGADARWFGGTDGETAPALLAVFEETTVGELMFRVSIGRPDLSRADQLTIIVELARAILPNFPYVVVEPPEPTVIEIERDLPPAVPPTLDDLVIAGEESGEWTRGEGLVEALKYLAAESSEFEPPDELDLFNGSGTGVIRLATDYLRDGPDDAMRAEIERLLARYTFPEPPEPQEPAGDDEVALSSGAGTRVFAAFALAQEPEPEEQVGCGLDPDWFGIDCTVVEDIGDVRFGYPRGAIEGSVEGWDIGDIELTRMALQTTIAEYTKYGTLAEADIVLSPLGDTFGTGVPLRSGSRCLIELRTAMQGLSAELQRFYVALELAGCFLDENLPDAVFTNYPATRWWFQGLTVFLAAEAFPNVNSEWNQPIDLLEATELSLSLVDRTVDNWPFFRSVSTNGGGPSAALAIVAPLADAATTQAQMEKLAAQSTSDPALHVFHQELSDSKIPDSGGSAQSYTPASSGEIELAGNTIILDDPVRFGVTRLQLTVSPGMYACIEYDISGNILSSWRTGVPGTGGGSWSFDLPEELTGEAVFLITTVEEDESFSATVEVSDEPDCDEEEEDPDDIEPPDCGLCSPSAYYRSSGAD